MSIQSAANLYPGINPHLNSFLQRETGWKGFHTHHLSDIARSLEAILPADYYTATEQSLQVGVYDAEDDVLAKSSHPSVPDVTIYQGQPARAQTQSSSMPQIGTPTLTIPLLERHETEEFVSSVVVYRLTKGKLPGKPVTRIELLSPANKPPGSHYDDYMQKRLDTLHSGLRLVELDYLHERRPILHKIPSYHDRDDGAYPYHIIVSDPRPTFDAGKSKVYSFGVLDSIPAIQIPLEKEESVNFDFNAVYQQTFESSRLFRILVDYAQNPVHFESYHPPDREKIQNKMQVIAENVKNATDTHSG